MATNRNILLLNTPLIFLELITILLLTYIAYGEANRKYEEFQFGKMAAQAEIIQNAMDSHLQAGIPIAQFGGFNSLSGALIQSDQYIFQISVFDTQNRDAIFINKQNDFDSNATFTDYPTLAEKSKAQHFKSASTYRVSIPLSGKFGEVGRVELDVSTLSVQQPIHKHFKQISIYCAIVFILFTLTILIFSARSSEDESRDNYRQKVMNFLYLISFLAISTVIASSMFKIYEEGASSKTAALTNAMGQRINVLLDLNIQLKDVAGLNKTFLTYQENNPEISMIALTNNGISAFHTDEDSIGTQYITPADSYEYKQTLKATSAQSQWSLIMAIPTHIVLDAVLSRANEFLVLMLACGLISWVFLDASTGLTQWARHKRRVRDDSGHYDNFEVGLRLIKPAYFIIVFTTALPVSFLPQLVTELAQNAESTFATATLPFTIFYFVFAAVLIPAGRIAEKVELKHMMIVGFITEIIGLVLISAGDGFWTLTFGRAFSGFAQGVFLIGLNSYTMSITPPDKRTQGAAVKVNGRNAALVSGTSIGALLYAFINYQAILIIAVVISLVGILYLWILVPSVRDLISDSSIATSRKKPANSSLKTDLIAVIKDREFVKTLFFIGFVGKMAITGVIMFAIPLILTERGLRSEDIGQSIILFYIASIVVTRYASRSVDTSGSSSNFLAISAFIGSIGILLIGITGISSWEFNHLFPGSELILSGVISFNHWIGLYGTADIEYYVILTGILLAGVANGMMAAPIMTHINKTEVARQYGNKAVSATYLFLERGGHVTGPMVVSFMLLFTYQTTLGIAFFGVITMIMSILFFLTSKQR